MFIGQIIIDVTNIKNSYPQQVKVLLGPKNKKKLYIFQFPSVLHRFTAHCPSICIDWFSLWVLYTGSWIQRTQTLNRWQWYVPSHCCRDRPCIGSSFRQSETHMCTKQISKILLHNQLEAKKIDQQLVTMIEQDIIEDWRYRTKAKDTLLERVIESIVPRYVRVDQSKLTSIKDNT